MKNASFIKLITAKLSKLLFPQRETITRLNHTITELNTSIMELNARITELSDTVTKSDTLSKQSEIDLGMVEVAMTIAGVGVAIVTFLLGIDYIQELGLIGFVVAFSAAIVATLSSYSAFTLLAWYLNKGDSIPKPLDICKLLVSKQPKNTPLAISLWGLLFWLILSFLLVFVVVICFFIFGMENYA